MKLKPCPFCGEEANKGWKNGRNGTFGFIKCDYCGGQSGVRTIEPLSWFETEDDFWNQSGFRIAAKLWNSRKRRSRVQSKANENGGNNYGE